ncbi:hypothetical protein LINPERHAP2_LOCUS36091 [Linum perenne]
MNLAIASWMSDVHQGTIANCFRHCKIRSRDEAGSNEINFEEDANELEGMINDMGYRNTMDASRLLEYPGENDEFIATQSLIEIVGDIVGSSIEDEGDDDSTPLEPVPRKETLKVASTLQNYLLQLEKTIPEILSAL